jgi:hypothetical protein
LHLYSNLWDEFKNGFKKNRKERKEKGRTRIYTIKKIYTNKNIFINIGTFNCVSKGTGLKFKLVFDLKSR